MSLKSICVKNESSKKTFYDLQKAKAKKKLCKECPTLGVSEIIFCHKKKIATENVEINKYKRNSIIIDTRHREKIPSSFCAAMVATT